MTAPATRRGGTTPRRTPAARPRESFIFGPWGFDVDHAGRLLAAAPREPVPLPVGAWAGFFGLVPGPPGTIPLIGPGPGFDRSYAMTTDLNVPVIVATITCPAGQDAGPLLIDGCHRLYKAHATGREHIPALVLTAAETLTIRRDIWLGPAGPFIGGEHG